MSTPLPTIHMNGTSPEMLRDEYADARTKIADAHEKLASVEFNGRDYYPQGPEAWTAAQDQYRKHLKALSDAADYCLAIAEHCQQAIDEKEQRRNERGI